jgi:hypothetical protein
VTAEIDVINESWNVDASSNDVADSVGLMVYEGTQALQYVKNYAQGADQWEGFPIKVSFFLFSSSTGISVQWYRANKCRKKVGNGLTDTRKKKTKERF